MCLIRAAQIRSRRRRSVVVVVVIIMINRDEEYDKGRTKKVKEKKIWSAAQGSSNP